MSGVRDDLFQANARTRRGSTWLVGCLALGLCSCGGEATSASASSTGGATGMPNAAIAGDGKLSCGRTPPCGGDVADTTWIFVDGCQDLGAVASTFESTYERYIGCGGIELKGSNLSDVGGSIRFNADGSYRSTPRYSQSLSFAIPATCLGALGAGTCDELARLLPQRSDALGEVRCASAEAGCVCDFSAPSGGTREESTYSAQTGQFDPSALTAGYCVNGALLHVTSIDRQGSMVITQDFVAVRQ